MKKIITSWYTAPMYSSILIAPQGDDPLINILYEYELEILDELSKIDIFVSDETPDQNSEKMYTKEKTFTICDVGEKELEFSIEDDYIYVNWDIRTQHDGEIVIYVNELKNIQLKKQSLVVSNFTESLDLESNNLKLDDVPNEIFDKDEYSFDSSKLRYSRYMYIEYVNNVFDGQEYEHYLRFYNLVPPHDKIELNYNGDIRFISYEEFVD